MVSDNGVEDCIDYARLLEALQYVVLLDAIVCKCPPRWQVCLLFIERFKQSDDTK